MFNYVNHAIQKSNKEVCNDQILVNSFSILGLLRWNKKEKQF